jgi:hypothetical protein
VTTCDDPPLLRDPALPADHLLGSGAAEVLAAAIGAAGGTVERSEPVQTTYHPGRSLTVLHRARVRWADGSRTDEELGLAAGRRAPDGAITISDGAQDLVVWRVPHDPWLPGLAAATDPDAVGGLLRSIGYDLGGEVRTRVRAYRPGRRAVVEVTAPGVRAFAKVVRPAKAQALRDVHEHLAGHVPVPAPIGWSPEHGIVLLQGLAGRTLRDALFARFPTPGPASLLALLDALPAPSDGTAPGPADWRAAEFATLLASIAPDLAARLDALVAGLAPFEAEATAEPVVPVHGDLYEAQLLVDGGAITGLLDIDTHRLGRRVDDLATAIGHLSVLAIGSPDHHAHLTSYATRLLDGFDRAVDPALLRAGVASVVLGLATGSFRVLEPSWQAHTEHRVALAEAWLASAHDLRRTLRHR